MRILGKTIPANFQRLDTRTNSADSFANCRDYHVAADNHNILLAERIRRVVYTQCFTRLEEETMNPMFLRTLGPINDNSPAVIMRIPLMLSQTCRSIMFVVRAYSESPANPQQLLLVVSKPAQDRPFTKGATITIDQAAETRFAAELDVPETPKIGDHGQIDMELRIALKCYMATSDFKVAASTVTTTSHKQVNTDANQAMAKRMAIYDPADPYNKARMVERDFNVSATQVSWVWPRWAREPVQAGLMIRQIYGIGVFSMSIYEMALSAADGFGYGLGGL